MNLQAYVEKNRKIIDLVNDRVGGNEIVDKYYGEVQKMGGNRWDTSSLIKRFRKK